MQLSYTFTYSSAKRRTNKIQLSDPNYWGCFVLVFFVNVLASKMNLLSTDRREI